MPSRSSTEASGRPPGLMCTVRRRVHLVEVRLLHVQMPSKQGDGCLSTLVPPALADRFREAAHIVTPSSRLLVENASFLEVLALFHMLPMFVLGTLRGQVSGSGLVLCSTFDAVVTVQACPMGKCIV
eukprot:s1993_g16.t1